MKSFKQFLLEGKVKDAMIKGTYNNNVTPTNTKYTFLFYFQHQYYHGDSTATDPATARRYLFSRLRSLLGRNAIGMYMKDTSPEQIEKGSQPRSSKEIP